MPRGRPPKPGTAAEKVAARREQVRLNVQALRARRKQQAVLLTESKATGLTQSPYANSQISSKAQDQWLAQKITGVKTSRDEKAFGQDALVVEHNGRWFPFLQSLDNGSPYAVAILGTFRESFLPDSIHMPTSIVSDSGQHWDSQDFLWTPCAFWVTSAFARAAYRTSGALRNILLAIGLGLKFMKYQDRDLEVASLQLYRKSLRSIRSSVSKVSTPGGKTKVDVSDLYLTCHAAAMYELMRNSDLRGSLQHLQGISMLIEYLEGGQNERDHTVPLLLLQDYRMAELAFCLRFRYESQMSRRARVIRDQQTKDSKAYPITNQVLELENCSMMIGLTDMADEVCAVMVALDKLRSTQVDENTVRDLFNLLEDLDQISTGFLHLKRQLLAKRGSIFIENEQQYELDDARAIKDTSKRFISFEVGVAWNYNLLIELFALEESISIIIGLQKLFHKEISQGKPQTPSHNLLEKRLARRLAQARQLLLDESIEITKCVSYFLQTDKGIAGQVLGIFPLDGASLMLTKELDRLTIDSNKLQDGDIKLEDEAEALKDKIMKAKTALSFCGKMQERASQFGLPSTYRHEQ